MDITLRQLRFLSALAAEGHFGRAAAAVNVSQPALSVQIRELEAALGARLVERGGRRVVVTPTGREVLRRARRILDEVNEIEQVARWDRGLAGRLRIGVIPTVAPYLLPSALPALRARNLSLDLGVREAQTERLIEEVRRGRARRGRGGAAGAGGGAGGGGALRGPLPAGREPGADRGAGGAGDGAAPRGHGGGTICCCSTTGTALPTRRSRPARWTARRVRMDLRAASLATLCRLVSEGFGLTLLPELAVRAECAAAPGLRLMRFAAPEPMRTIGLVRRALSVDDGWFGELAGDPGRGGAGGDRRGGVRRIAAFRALTFPRGRHYVGGRHRRRGCA